MSPNTGSARQMISARSRRAAGDGDVGTARGRPCEAARRARIGLQLDPHLERRRAVRQLLRELFVLQHPGDAFDCRRRHGNVGHLALDEPVLLAADDSRDDFDRHAELDLLAVGGVDIDGRDEGGDGVVAGIGDRIGDDREDYAAPIDHFARVHLHFRDHALVCAGHHIDAPEALLDHRQLALGGIDFELEP